MSWSMWLLSVGQIVLLDIIFKIEGANSDRDASPFIG